MAWNFVFENLAVAKLVKNSPAPYGTLFFGLCSQKPDSEFNPEPVQSSRIPTIVV